MHSTHSWGHLRHAERLKGFQEGLLLLLHLTGGMPGRGTEVTSVKCQNTQLALRNIFIYRGQLAYMTEYCKFRSLSNCSFYVARFLPDSVGIRNMKSGLPSPPLPLGTNVSKKVPVTASYRKTLLVR